MISTVTYNGDGVTRIFPVAFEIKGEDYVVVFINNVGVSDRTLYDIINNSIVFNIAPVTGTNNIEIVVASTTTEIADLNAPPSSIQTVLDNLTEITDVATLLPAIENVNNISAELLNVNGFRAEIENVSNISDDVEVVSNGWTNIQTVSSSISKINKVGNDLAIPVSSKITKVSDNITNVNLVGGSITNVNTVAGDLTNIDRVSTDLALGINSAVKLVGADIQSVKDVAGIRTQVANVAGNLSSVTTVDSNIATITNVNSNMSSVIGVNNNIAQIDSVASNMSEVLLAAANASIATQKANEALQSALQSVSSANFIGTWNSATTYTLGQSVVYNNIFYRALQTSLNQNPSTQTAYWIKNLPLPTTSTDNAIARFDGITGNIQNSGVVIDDSGKFTNGLLLPNTAIANATTLDWYEEGTFTPALTFSGGTSNNTYSAQTGNYTRIGDIVYYSARVTLTAKDGGGSGYITITGLPFSTSKYNSGSFTDRVGITPSGAYLDGMTVHVAGTAIRLMRLSTTSYDNIQYSEITGTMSLTVSGTYKV